MNEARMRRPRHWLWVVLVAAPLPFIHLCSRSSGPEPRLVGTRPSPKGRGPANSDRLAVQWGKIEIDTEKLIAADGRAFDAMAPSMKLGGPGTAIAKGTRLMAVTNNDCLQKIERERASGFMKALPLSLSERAFEASEKEEIDELKVQAYSFEVDSSLSLDQLVAEAEDDPCIEHVSDDRVVRLNLPARAASGLPTDPSAGSQAHLASVKLGPANDFFFASSRRITKDVVVAVVDSGIDANHEDLAANMWRSKEGDVGYDFVNGDSDPADDLGHGTHVAGLIGAVGDNGKGVSGIMGKRVKLMAVKVINGDNEGSMSDYVNGLRWAADRGAEVINLSLGGSQSTKAEEDAIRYVLAKGAVVIAAAGNDNKALSPTSNDYPAGYSPSMPGLIAVGSIDTETGQRSNFSNHSPAYVAIAAPGAEKSDSYRGLLSTMPGNAYDRFQGTSMSTPLVSGAAALIVGAMKSEGHAVSNVAVVDVLLGSARIDTNLTSYFKNGRVLDLERMARAVKWRYFVDSDGGTEDAQ